MPPCLCKFLLRLFVWVLYVFVVHLLGRYVSLHAYGQSWLTPWGYRREPAPHSRHMEEVRLTALDSFFAVL